MSQLNTFVTPAPNFALIKVMDWVNRIVMLKGVVGLRDIPLLNRLAGPRGVANIRSFEIPAFDQQRLRAATAPGKACFVTPNHPEFFTDWMIDKELASRFFPKAAFWATNHIVNGLGKTVQKFWLANNLIAQIPGNSAPARDHSIAYALAGNTVLLHPEGQVGWRRNSVASLMTGAAEMAMDVARQSREQGVEREVWLAPVVWKLTFIGNVEPALSRECAYVEQKLHIDADLSADLAARVYHIYATLLARDEAALDIISGPDEAFAQRHARVIETLCALLARTTQTDPMKSPTAILRAVRKFLKREDKSDDASLRTKEFADRLEKALRISEFAWARPTISLEEIAEHIKRLRADHCFGSWRDTLNRFVPQPAGPRIAHIRVPEPIAIHEYSGTAVEATEELQRRLQSALDSIDERLQGRVVRSNPFRG